MRKLGLLGTIGLGVLVGVVFLLISFVLFFFPFAGLLLYFGVAAVLGRGVGWKDGLMTAAIATSVNFIFLWYGAWGSCAGDPGYTGCILSYAPDFYEYIPITFVPAALGVLLGNVFLGGSPQKTA